MKCNTSLSGVGVKTSASGSLNTCIVRTFSAYLFSHPSIAQLVERWTVVVWSSIGRWFESGSKDFFV